ncbi:MAG TPA: HAD family phosphatase [Clostridia bacterium]|jgi:HAD superfamily hydrolase (TIGR01509 family)|nr:HAD family phosphatase [Clostridiaceae bacterium]HPZ52447.1 HAD family phosphatase [Clostridia bacterium]
MKTSIKAEALVFDMDGTLLDSLYYWRNTDLYAAKAFNFEPNKNIKLSEQPGSFFERVKNYVNLHGFDHDLDTIKEELHRVAIEFYTTEVTPKHKAVNFLEHVLSQGKRIGIATATNGRVAKIALEHLGLLEYFEFVLSNDDIGVSKRHPDIYLLAAEKLGQSVENTIVFEDNPNCVRTAKNAGFRVAGINDRHFSEEENKMTADIADWTAWDYEYYIELFKA